MSKKPSSETGSHEHAGEYMPDAEMFTGDVEVETIGTLKKAKIPIQQLDYISMGQLQPGVAWINQNVVSKPPGYHLALAVLTGYCRKCVVKMNTIQGQSEPVESIEMIGRFKATSLLDESIVMQSTRAYLPKKWGSQVKEITDQFDPEDTRASVSMVLNLGIRTTGKPIAYAWTVATLIEDDSDQQMAQLEVLAGLRPAEQKRLSRAIDPDVTTEQAAD